MVLFGGVVLIPNFLPEWPVGFGAPIDLAHLAVRQSEVVFFWSSVGTLGLFLCGKFFYYEDFGGVSSECC